MFVALILGLIVGATAKLLMPGRDPGGWFITCLLGMAGSCVATLVGHRAGYYSYHEPAGFIASVLGALLILAIYRILLKTTRHSH